MNCERTRLMSEMILCRVLAFAALAVVVAGCGKKASDTANKEKPVEVTTLTVKAIAFSDTFRLPAMVEPVSQAVLATEKAGIVREIVVDRGSKVAKGQLMMKLDDRQARLAAQQAELNLAEAGKDLKRWQTLKPTGAVSDSNYESILTRFDMATLAYSNAVLNLDMCEVRSPLDGMVDDRYFEVGENADMASRVFKVVNIDDVKLTADLPEREVATVQSGSAMTFEVDVLPGVLFTGQVSFVAAAADPQSNTFRMEVQADNAEGVLRPGMIARIALTRRVREDAIVLPLNAIIPRKGDHVVFTVEKGLASRKLVKIEEITGSEAVIGSGLMPGDEVVIEGNRTLADGMAVIVANGKAAGAVVPKAE